MSRSSRSNAEEFEKKLTNSFRFMLGVCFFVWDFVNIERFCSSIFR